MATDTRIIRSTNADDVEFRAWAQAVHDALIAVGLVQTTDTGQINFATVARPIANADAGYAVYRFSDALQATRPVFIRILFGSSAAVATPRLGLSIGTGTNGAGTLNGISSANRSLINTNPATANVQSWASGSTNRVTFCLWGADAVTGRSIAFGVERTHDAAGDDSNAGVRLWTASSGSGTSTDDISYAGPTFAGSGVVAAMSNSETTGVNGSDTVFFPMYGAPKIGRFPLTGLVGFYNADAANGSDVLVDPDGHGLKTYRTLNALAIGPVGGNSRFAMRFD